MPQSLYFRLAGLSDVTTLFDIRQAAIRQLSLTHLSECEAAAWAERGGIPRVERAIASEVQKPSLRRRPERCHGGGPVAGSVCAAWVAWMA